MAKRLFVLKQLAMVPVGGEVEIRFFQKPKRSSWDGSLKDVRGEPVQHEAVIRDLATGVIFGMDWHFQLGLDSPTQRDACPELVLVETVRGRVTSCQVVCSWGSGEQRIETWLQISALP
ncbi:MAG TPA: hypothetical protein VFQ61_20070 [Polyangiaceae bacterium]|nr:hypothetical protein [Polyangiaceae bacterium]